MMEFTIAKSTEPLAEFKIPANKVESTLSPTCGTLVYAQYRQPFGKLDKPAGWYDVSPSESLDLSYMTPQDGMYILWKPTQQDYINLVGTFGTEDSIAIDNYVPPHLDIDLKFITVDETNEER
jgi:hypothetical protein